VSDLKYLTKFVLIMTFSNYFVVGSSYLRLEKSIRNYLLFFNKKKEMFNTDFKSLNDYKVYRLIFNFMTHLYDRMVMLLLTFLS